MQEAICSLPIFKISPPAGAFIRLGLLGYEINGKNIIRLGNLLRTWAHKDEELLYWNGKSRLVTISWWGEFERTSCESLKAT